MWTPLSQSLSSVLVLVLVLAAAGHSAQLPVFTTSLSAGGNIPGCCWRACRSQLFDRSTLRSCLLLLQLLHQFLLHSYSIARSACQSPPLNPPPRYEVDRVASRIRHQLPRQTLVSSVLNHTEVRLSLTISLLLSLSPSLPPVSVSVSAAFLRAGWKSDDQSPAELSRQTWISVKRCCFRCFGYYC